MKRPQIAKLTRPRLHRVVARQALFRKLDEKRIQPVIWISGPPGAGKTTLVTSYLGHIGGKTVWYHLDRDDSDPATFFYYLSQGTEHESRRAGRLPLLTPEYLGDLEGFGRRFFRQAFACLPAGAVLVLDNYHELSDDSVLHRILNAAFAEVPETSNVIVVSRVVPPPVFVRMHVADKLATIGWEDLRLTAAETEAIVSARIDGASRELIETIHAQAGGWAAGVRLLLDRIDLVGNSARADLPRKLDSVFDYFASELFDAAPEDTQRVLLLTALLPRFTADMAIEASQNPEAEDILEDLYRRRLFVERRPGAQTTYQYHDLFRTFLRSRLQQMCTHAELASRARSTANLLLGWNFGEQAFGLFVQAGDWDAAEKLFIDQAGPLIAQGRWKTLEEWGNVLPADRLAANPWLRYWLGRSKTLVEPGAARVVLEAAYASFVGADDHTGQLLGATAVVDALHFEVKAFQLLGPWLDRIAALVDQADRLSIEDDLRVHAALSMASHLALLGPTLARAIERAKLLLPRCSDPNVTLSAANMIHYYSSHCLDADAHRIAAAATRPLLGRTDLSADRVALYYLAEGHAHYSFARYREALNCFDRADALITEHGLTQRTLVLGAWRCQCEAAIGDIASARRTIARTEATVLGGHGFISALFESAKAAVAFAAGEVERSLELGVAAMEQNRVTGSPISQALWVWRIAYRLMVAGRIDEARKLIAQQEAEPEIVAYCHIGGAVAMMRAWIAMRTGDMNECDAALRLALAHARDERDRLRLRWAPLALADLLPRAFARGIEPDVGRMLVSECALRAAHPSLEAWPWPIRIYTLGRFAVLVDGKPIEFGRKAPKRTLALLKAIVALGGSEVPEQRLIDALWPDQDGDAAQEALAAALYRLRRLLGRHQAILQSGGALSLDPQCCFVDAWAFESALEEAANEEMALRVYRGGFLQGDVDAQWTVSLRERLRAKFVRVVRSRGQVLETAGRLEEAASLYERGIEADELVEPFYQGLMRSYCSLGRAAEAADVYLRLSRTLSGALGIQPSAESARLFAGISAPARIRSQSIPSQPRH